MRKHVKQYKYYNDGSPKIIRTEAMATAEGTVRMSHAED